MVLAIYKLIQIKSINKIKNYLFNMIHFCAVCDRIYYYQDALSFRGVFNSDSNSLYDGGPILFPTKKVVIVAFPFTCHFCQQNFIRKYN